MTICVAGIADSDKAIVFAIDKMLSVGMTTGELPLLMKSIRIHKHWFALYAGDVTQVPLIKQKVASALPDDGRAPSVDEVANIFVRAYREARIQLAEQVVLSPFGLDMRTFIAMLASNDSAELADMRRKIQGLEFDVEFLVGGFDENGLPHLFTVRPPGVSSFFDPIKFWSIGSGADAAISSLMFRRYTSTLSVKEATYFIAEAKFMSETAIGVGRDTTFLAMTSDGQAGMILTADKQQLRQIWETEGQPPVPKDLERRAPDFMDLHEIVRGKRRVIGKGRKRKAGKRASAKKK